MKKLSLLIILFAGMVLTSCKKYTYTCHCITMGSGGFSNFGFEGDIEVKGKKGDGEALCKAKNKTTQTSNGSETTECVLK